MEKVGWTTKDLYFKKDEFKNSPVCNSWGTKDPSETGMPSEHICLHSGHFDLANQIEGGKVNIKNYPRRVCPVMLRH